MFRIPRMYKRNRLVITVIILLIFMILYNLNSSINTTTKKHTPIREVKEQVNKIKIEPLSVDDDDEYQLLLPPPPSLPKLAPELVGKVQDELEEQEQMEVSRNIFKDIKHSQGFTKHVENGDDLLSDSGHDSYPILYNRMRLGKISSNFVVTGDEKYPIPMAHKWRNPITKYRELPTMNKRFPKIQTERLTFQANRYNRVKNLFIENWNQYFYYSKKFDSFKPLTLSGENDYIGWSMTLIDSLDTLFIMGFSAEFEMAVAEIETMNFFEIKRDDVPVFETNIRILGGLLSGFDISNDYRLLDKAKEVANILLGAFDTVNNLPIMYYNVNKNQQDREIYPSMTNYLSELGSLSLEFTRLSILTKDMKYYTYVMNLIDAIIESQDDSLIKGLIPNQLDASGCEKIFRDDDIATMFDGKLPENAKKVLLVYDFNDDNEVVYCIPSEKKIRPTSDTKQVFSMEGKSDSFYEYLLKLYILLNGNVSDEYIIFFENAKEKIKKFLTFTPKMSGRDMTFLNEITVTKKNDGELTLTQHNQVSHLSCFAGGFFALSNRVFLEHSDLEFGDKLIRSCVKISDKMGGLFPESFMVDSCDDLERCEYDEAERIKFIETHTTNKKIEYKKLAKINYSIKDNELEYHVKTSSKIPYAPYDSENKIWKTGELANQPLEFNDMDPRYMLRPELIESLFINFRITGLEIYREQAWEIFEKIAAKTGSDVVKGKESELVQATIRDVTGKYGELQYIDELESWWFAETLKYFYLIFQDSKVLSLDEWVFNTQGHPLRKEKFWFPDY